MSNTTDARVEIAGLLAALTNFGDAGRLEEFSKFFAKDGTYMLHNGRTAKGPEAIGEMLTTFSKHMAKLGDAAPKYMRHNITTSHVKVDDHNKAQGDTYFLNVNEKGLDHWGRWHDRFVRDAEGHWLFASREVLVEGMARASWLNSQT